MAQLLRSTRSYERVKICNIRLDDSQRCRYLSVWHCSSWLRSSRARQPMPIGISEPSQDATTPSKHRSTTTAWGGYSPTETPSDGPAQRTATPSESKSTATCLEAPGALTPATSSTERHTAVNGSANATRDNTGPRLAADTGAGHAIVKYAGFSVKQYNSSEDVVYNKENLLNPWFLVK